GCTSASDRSAAELDGTAKFARSGHRGKIRPVIAWVRWVGPSLVPALLLLVLIYLVDRRREPPWLLLLVFCFGAAGKLGTWLLEARAASWTGLDAKSQIAGSAGSTLFLFGFAAPIREASKVAAMWPAFRSKYFDEATDGIIYAAATALGF